MTRAPSRRKPPSWFKWAVWAGIAAAVALPAACMMIDGAAPSVSSEASGAP